MASGRKPKVNDKPKRKSKTKKRKEEEEEEKDDDDSRRGSWRRLPPDVAAKIFGLVPLHHAINAQAVCRQWRASLLHQHSSISQDAKGDTLSPLFVVFNCCGNYVTSAFCGYHAATRKWVRYPNLAFLPFSITRVHSSHRGLLLVEAGGSSALYLCNLATQRHWPLPPPPPDGPQRMHFGGSMYWCHCHLQVDADLRRFTIVALRRTNCASGWPELVGFDSSRGSWSPLQVDVSLASYSYIPKVFFEGVDRIVVQSNGTIYMMVPGRDKSCYLVKYDPNSCVWLMVDKLHVVSAQIVTFQDTLTVVALDTWRKQVHLYRVEEEQLVLEQSSGSELAQFVDDCSIHYWYTTFCTSSCQLYIGVSVNEAVAHNIQQALVEYEALSRTWRHVALPKLHYEVEQENCRSFVSTSYSHSLYTRSSGCIIAGVAYHELGLASNLDCPEISDSTE